LTTDSSSSEIDKGAVVWWFHDTICFLRRMFAIASGETLFLFSGPVAEWNISKGTPTLRIKHKIHNP